MTSYMRSTFARPIMTNSESLLQFGSNAYGKPATAMNVLRETVLGREAMDHAFRTYASDWAFKRPQPADLFRRLEDVSGTDLDWFWRGWFCSTAHADVAIEKVTYTQLARDPKQKKGLPKPSGMKNGRRHVRNSVMKGRPSAQIDSPSSSISTRPTMNWMSRQRMSARSRDF